MSRHWVVFFIMIMVSFCFPKLSLAAGDLQSLLNSAEEGAFIKLENRTYEGNIVIEKRVELIGSGKTVIKGDGTGNVISVRAPGVKLHKLTVTGGSMNRNSSEEFAAIKVYTNGNLIDDVNITDSFHGVYLSKSHENTIQNVNVTGLGKGEIAAQGNGLHIWYSNSNTLKNNVITGTRDGMFFHKANDNIIQDNQISHTRYGLHYMYADRNEFNRNHFSFNTGGAAIMHSNESKLSDNQFVFNYGHRSFGLLLLSANQIEAENNLFFLNQRGIYIDQSTENFFRNNEIIKNQIGIELWASSNQQIFSENRIHENTIPAVSLGGQGQNSWSDNGIGNDWGKTFPLADLDRDGKGDYPIIYHSSLHQLIEDQELTYLFLKSPAIAVYEKMNEFLHKGKVMFEDPHPLVHHKEKTFQWAWIPLVAVISFVIIRKGRNRLCIIFGRNGRKT